MMTRAKMTGEFALVKKKKKKERKTYGKEFISILQLY